VWVASDLINELMVRDGWALLYTVPPNVRYAERLARAQKLARANGAGLWSQGGFACAPSRFRRDRCLNQP
jgi:micrococcal nuclease